MDALLISYTTAGFQTKLKWNSLNDDGMIIKRNHLKKIKNAGMVSNINT